VTAFRGLPPIISAPGAANTLPDKLSGEILLVTDAGVVEAGLLAKLSHSNWPTLVQDIGEPTHEMIDELADYLRQHTPDWVVGLGGGSVLDVVKLASCVASGGHPCSDLTGEAPLPAPLCQRALLPTTAGSGSEATRTAVFKDSKGRKTWVQGEHLGCEMVVLDGEFTVGLPHQLSALSGLNTVANALEAFLSPRCCEFASSFCLQALNLAGLHLPLMLANLEDRKARQGMLIASFFAGVGLDLCGGGIAHAAAHAASTITGCNHSVGVVWATPVSIYWSLPNAPERYARAARALAFDSYSSIMQAWRGVEQHCGELPQPSGLTEVELKAALQLPENASMLRNNPHPVGPGEFDEMVELLLVHTD